MNTYRASTIKRTGVTGTVYMLRFKRKYKNKQFYIGFTKRPIHERLAEHVSGNGAAITRAAVLAGIDMEVVRTWDNVDSSVEFLIKCRAKYRALSPIDNPNGWFKQANYEAAK